MNCCNTQGGTLRIVQGNDFTLGVLVKEAVLMQGGTQLVDFDLTGSTGITVTLVSRFGKRTPITTFSVTGSTVAVRFDETLPCGVYGIEVKGKTSDGKDWRFAAKPGELFSIVPATSDANIPQDQSEVSGYYSVTAQVAVLAIDPELADSLKDIDVATVQAVKNAKSDIAALQEAVTAEEKRATAEAAREEAEASRQSAEQTRTSAETARQEAESARVSAEQTRTASEEERKTVEASRQSAETERQNAETARSTAEEQRNTDEQARQSAEETRQTQETARQTAESAREKAETERQSTFEANEASRSEAESERVKAEQARVAAEQARAEAEVKRQDAETNREAVVADLEEKVAGAENLEITNTDNTITITHRDGTQSTITVEDEKETVTVKLSADTDTDGNAVATVSGTVLSVYLNHGSTPVQYTVGEDGTATFTVQKGEYYEVNFPDKANCKPISPVGYTATVVNRTIEAKYEAYTGGDVEQVTVTVRKRSDGAFSAWEGATVHVKVGTADAVDYTTDSSGNATFEVQLGQEYTVSMDEDTTDGYYIHMGDYSKSYTAKTTTRKVWMDWYAYRTGCFLIASDGVERTADEWDTDGITETDGVMVKVVTQALSEGGGIVYMDIDGIIATVNKTDGAYVSKQWAKGVMQQTSIDGISNSRTAANYYNGQAATDIIIAACEAQDCEAPAASQAKTYTKTVGGKTMTGYLPALGQYEICKTNETAIDTLFKKVKGDDTKVWSNLTNNKWTSTQFNADNAVGFASSSGSLLKYASYLAVPFFA